MKKCKTLNIVLSIVGILIVLFIVMMIITFWKFQQVPEVLVTAVLGTGIAELILTTIITVCKHIWKKDNPDFLEEEEEKTEESIVE